MRRPFGWLLAGFLLCAATPATIPVSECNALLAKLARNAREAGYAHGLEDGRQEGRRDSFVEATSADARAAQYEDCLGRIRWARARDDAYLRAVVDECLKLLPPSKAYLQ